MQCGQCSEAVQPALSACGGSMQGAADCTLTRSWGHWPHCSQALAGRQGAHITQHLTLPPAITSLAGRSQQGLELYLVPRQQHTATATATGQLQQQHAQLQTTHPLPPSPRVQPLLTPRCNPLEIDKAHAMAVCCRYVCMLCSYCYISTGYAAVRSACMHPAPPSCCQAGWKRSGRADVHVQAVASTPPTGFYSHEVQDLATTL